MPIFLSYSRKDEEVVEVLAQGFEAARREVWFDKDLGGGDAWWDKILDNIRLATVFVFALSDESLRSKPCRAELDYARALGRPVLPVQVGPVANIRSSPVADLQIIRFQRDNLLSAFKIMDAIDEAAQQQKPLPDPLPTPPPIPFAYLRALGRQIDSVELDQADQAKVVDQLRHAIAEETDESVRGEILANLHNLMSKPWATKRTETDVKAIMYAAMTPKDKEDSFPDSKETQSSGYQPGDGTAADSHGAGDHSSGDKRFYRRYIGALVAAFIVGSLGFLAGITDTGVANPAAYALFGFLVFGGPTFLLGWLLTGFSRHRARRPSDE
jgi:TIR domain